MVKVAFVTNTGEIKPTNAGMLFFGYEPQQSVPQGEVVRVIYRDERRSTSPL